MNIELLIETFDVIAIAMTIHWSIFKLTVNNFPTDKEENEEENEEDNHSPWW